jgi:hypothetical protein
MLDTNDNVVMFRKKNSEPPPVLLFAGVRMSWSPRNDPGPGPVYGETLKGIARFTPSAAMERVRRLFPRLFKPGPLASSPPFQGPPSPPRSLDDPVDDPNMAEAINPSR